MTARGIRANNPGNIRKGENWRGLAKWVDMSMCQRTEKDFCVFIAPIYGIRALARLMLTYQNKYKLNTVHKIISRYAPSSENNTKSYSEHVAHSMGLQDAGTVIDVTDFDTMHDLIVAIIRHENGSQPYTHEIDDGILLAGVIPSVNDPNQARLAA
jgi:hypothetical protein